MWLVLTPVALFLLLAVLIYLPPVQKWAVDKAADWLSEEMQMDVSVENVRLKFPLDLSMGGMLAVQEGDTVLNAEELRLSVQARPLLDGLVNVDDIILKEADVNTRGLIDEVLIKGHIGELEAYTHGVDLSKELVTVNKLALKDADVMLALPDTVPPDTTESKPVKWKIDMQDVALDNVKFALALPQKKGYDITDLYKQRIKAKELDLDTYFGKADMRAFIDLENGVYTVGDLKAAGANARFREAVDATGIVLESDSIRFALPMDLYVNIKQMSGKERCGLNFRNVQGDVKMDTLQLMLPDMKITTDDSELGLDMTMDLDTWDEETPGTMQLGLKSVMGKSDIMAITRYVDRYMPEDRKLDAVRDLVKQYVPVKPVPLNVKVEGNLQDMHFDDIQANIYGIGRLDGAVRMQGDDISANVHGMLAGGDAVVDGKYNMDTETYDVVASLKDFNVNKYVDLPEKTRLTGVVKAKGKGFDVYSPQTTIAATADVRKGRYGKVDLSSIKADVQLRKQMLDMNVSCDNTQLVTDFNLKGRLKKGVADGTLDINMPFADISAMGFADGKMQVKTGGKVDFYSNLDKLFRVDGHVDGLDIETEDGNIHTEDFELYAETTRDSTAIDVQTGDLDVRFNAQDNLFHIADKGGKLVSLFAKQRSERNVNFDILRSYMPEAQLYAKAGRNNPLATYLKTEGIGFQDLLLNLNASPELGVVGDGYVNNLQKDSMQVERIFFNIYQEANNLKFSSGVESKGQSSLPAFKADIDGYLSTRTADARLRYYDKDGIKGVDIGAHFVGLDSVWRLTMYPEKPVIAYRQFELADTSFVDFYREKGHPIIGNVQLKSLEDDCDISIIGIDNEGEQRALFEVNNFNLNELAKVMPLMPKMGGLFSIDAAYQEDDDVFWVDGIMDISDFEYEGMKVGNVGSLFTYEPEGLTLHKLEGDISYDGVDVLTVNGKYDAGGEGYLDANLELLDIPMEMLSPFVPDKIVTLGGNLAGEMSVTGPVDGLRFNGFALPKDVTVASPYYSVRLKLAEDTVRVEDSRVEFDKYAIYGSGTNPIELSGNVDFRNFDNIPLSLSLVGKNIQLIDSKRTTKSVLFGNAFGDIYANITGTTNDIVVRGGLDVLNTTNVTYLMTETALSQGDRLDDIVTFVDFSLPTDSTKAPAHDAITGIDMNMRLNIEDGTRVRCEFSADRQSYVNVRGGGSLSMVYTPEGMMNVQGRVTVNEGEMKYTLPVIPLKTFVLKPGSYVDFNGDMYNPTLNINAVSRTKAVVNTEGTTSRSVAFDVGLKIFDTLNNMGLAFTLDAPDDGNMQEELNGYTDEDKGKLAVALLATGMYVADNNSSALTASTALSSFLQAELNNITGRALNSIVDVNIGMDEKAYGRDYSFKFSKRFFSDRLSVVIGGRVSDNEAVNRSSDIGSFIDDVSLEWRIDPSGTCSVRLFHNKDYKNMFEGLLEKNGAGVVLRKKMDNLSELIFWKKKEER